MVTQLQPDVRAYLHGGEVIKRYIRVEEVAHEYGFSVEETEYIAKAASSLYKLTRIHLVKKERFDEFMKHIYKVPGTNKQIIKKFARIGEASIIYSIGSTGTKDVEETDADGNVTTVTKSVLYVNVTLKSYRDMISVYGFDANQVEMLEQIMSADFMGQLGYAGSGSGGGGGSPGVSSMTEDEINAILSGITDSRQKKVCSYALHRVGFPYSQDMRDSGNYYDCSSLAYYSWKDAGVRSTAKGIVEKAKEKGRAALYRVSEFLGIKKRLLDIRENVRGAIKTTDKDIAKTALLAKGFREAGQTVANAFRTFADNPEVDYSQKEQKHPITKAVLAPMKAVKKMLVSIEIHLDASIDKLDNLAMDVRMDKEKNKDDMASFGSTGTSTFAFP